MNILDKAGRIPASETLSRDDWRFVNACLGVIDRASATNWGLPDNEKVIATLLKLWYDAQSAAVASDYEEEVVELRNKLKGANMAKGRAEARAGKLAARVEELEDLVRGLTQDNKL